MTGTDFYYNIQWNCNCRFRHNGRCWRRNTSKITLTLGDTEVSGDILITDEAGNAGNGGSFTIDNTNPTVTNVATRYIKSGATTVITGTGFKNHNGSAIGDASRVDIGNSEAVDGNHHIIL